MPVSMKVITLLGYPFALLHVGAHLLTEPQLLWRVIAGLLLCWLAAGLFLAALRANKAKPLSLAGSKDAPEHLNQDGPYARIRHPFYASYFYTWAGSALMGPWWLWSAPVVMGALYWHHAGMEERKFLSSPLAPDYRAYMGHAGLFWPRLFAGRNHLPKSHHA
jgi:protein-S-isoprenylcysteine O-methyltransferase Ste14